MNQCESCKKQFTTDDIESKNIVIFAGYYAHRNCINDLFKANKSSLRI